MPKKSLNAWQKRQAKDPFVKDAKRLGYRSRAAFKLIEMQERKQLFKPNMHILELGAAPGGWSQLISEWIAPSGVLDAVDILPMQDLRNVRTHVFDIESEAFFAWCQNRYHTETTLDWVVSDMAPNMSGHQNTDQLRSIALCEQALEIAIQYAQPGSNILLKAFQGIGIQEFCQELKGYYQHFQTLKPKASERSSREIYLLGLGKL